jgi:hypothetical protein
VSHRRGGCSKILWLCRNISSVHLVASHVIDWANPSGLMCGDRLLLFSDQLCALAGLRSTWGASSQNIWWRHLQTVEQVDNDLVQIKRAWILLHVSLHENICICTVLWLRSSVRVYGSRRIK